MGTRQQALNEGIYLDNRMVVEYVQRGRTGLPGARLEGQYDDQRARPRTNQADQPPEYVTPPGGNQRLDMITHAKSRIDSDSSNRP